MTPAGRLENRSRRPILLATRLTPPPVRDHAVPRDRLMERLRGGPGLRLSLVAGPAGFGKDDATRGVARGRGGADPAAVLAVDCRRAEP